MRVVQGRPQHYDWGDLVAIPRLLGLATDGRPWAEFWWGTHEAAPSTIDDGQPLIEVTGPLPYLVKLLAAARPLSLQLHPSAEQAAAGFARDVERRIYRDPWPKPEMICALTRFEALCGLASPHVVTSRIDSLGTAADEFGGRYRTEGTRAVMSWLLRERPNMTAVVDAARRLDEPWAAWLVRLAGWHPDDPAVAAVIMLHHIVLEPGEAMFLGAGHLHAYLHGVGLEVMGPSDNVVRGGLTSKYVDVDAVVALMSETVLDEPVVRPQRRRHEAADVDRYDVAEAPFVVERWKVAGTTSATAEGDELWWCAEGDGPVGRGVCVLVRDGDVLPLERGSVLYRVTAAARRPTPDRADAPGR
jgi:mannose-6-phosphate isomerase